MSDFMSKFWRCIYLSLRISPSFDFSLFELFFGEDFETLVILLGILFPMKPLVAFAVFWIALSEIVSSASAAYCWAWSRSF